MKHTPQRGTTLAVGLVLLTAVTLLGIAGASAAHVERRLAQNETFRENAATAASAGIEMAIRAIVSSSGPATVPTRLVGRLPGATEHFEVDVSFAGLEPGLPAAPGAQLCGAHFDIVSSGYAARNARDRQRAAVMWVVESCAVVPATDCEPLQARHCHERGLLERLSWQRVPFE